MGRSNSSLELFFKREWNKVKMLIKIFWVNIFFNFSYASRYMDYAGTRWRNIGHVLDLGNRVVIPIGYPIFSSVYNE